MTDKQTTLLMEPESLSSAIENDEELLIVAVCSEAVFQHKHIPGAVLVQPADLVSGIKPAVGKLPDQQRLNALFSRIGLAPDKKVIAYDDEGGGWAGRLIWTLDLIGHDNYAYLNGGLVAWMKSGLPVASEADRTIGNPVEQEVTIDASQLRNKEFLLTHLDDIGKDELQIWDARSPQEFTGEKVTSVRNGHIPGARNLDWLELMDRDNDLRLLPKDAILAKLKAQGIRTDLPTVTHCQTHHRSGLTYLVGKLLGMDIAAYDGSWSEWGNDPDTPVATGLEN